MAGQNKQIKKLQERVSTMKRPNLFICIDSRDRSGIAKAFGVPTYGAYVRAREALDEALTQEQLFSGNDQLHGIHVMNMHKFTVILERVEPNQ